jgi:hypothetical protein
MVHLLDTKLKKTKESLVSRLNKKLQQVAQETTPQQISSLLRFRTPSAVMRIQKSEKNHPDINVLLPEITVLQQSISIILCYENYVQLNILF